MNNFKFSRKQGYLVSLVLIVFTICGSHAQSGKSNFIRTYTPRVPILDQTLVKPDMAIQDAQQTTAHFDGLGRMSQVMVRGASPEGMLNSTSAIRYGSDGSREEFLPLPIINSTDRLMSDVYNMTNQYYLSRKNASDAYAYTRVDMLDRPIESRLPGDAVKAISTIYRPGNASDEIDEIVFTAGTNQLSRLGYYSNGALKVTITTDQNDHQVIEYTNKLEQMVCKSSQANEAGTVFAKTYYVYDDYGNLTFIIPPEASKEALLDWSKLDDPVFRNDWFFQYRYDKRQRMIEKKMPGIAPTHMVYDNRDRLVLTQDGNQRGGSLIEVTSSQSTSAYIPNTNYVITSGSLTLTDGFHATGDFLATTNGNQLTGEWLFTKYDELNRPVLTGQVQLTGSRHEVQQLVDTDPSYNFTTTFIGNTGADLLGYDNTNFARTIPEVLSVSYYDNYNFMTLPEWGLPVSSPTGAVARARTLPTGIKTKVLGSNDFLDEVLYYDIRFRLVQNVKENHLGGTDTWTNTYVNDVLNLISQTQREHVASGQTTVVVDRYEYDHLNRVTNHYHRMGTDPANEILLVSHHYNDIGELEVKDVGEAQKQDYTYNIKGWLQSINGGTDFNDVSDVFGMELKYADASSGHQQYNGNIGEISWKSVAGSGNDDAQTYRFKYDPLNRLKKATYTSLNRANHYNVFGNGADNTILYDLNGNIKSLKRNFDGNQVDNLDYAYEHGNLLSSVSDSEPDVGMSFDEASSEGLQENEYVYDANGNMTSDANKGISSITYNHLNLPETVVTSGGTIHYTYSAAGIKLRKLFDPSSGSDVMTDYISGLQYRNSNLDFVQHQEGRYRFASAAYDFDLRDHLGNNRVTFTRGSSTTQWIDEIFNYQFDGSDNPQFDIEEGNITTDLFRSAPSSLRVRDDYDEEYYPVQHGDQVDVHGWVNEGSQGEGEVSIYHRPTGSITPNLLTTLTVAGAKNNWHQVSASNLIMPSDGSLIVRLNTTTENHYAYYDDLQVTISRAENRRSTDVVQRDDYYPFGLSFNHWNASLPGSSENLFKFNGKEEQKEWRVLDFNTRMHDPELGRFMGVDLLAEKYSYQSAYAYAVNNPVLHRDILGMGVTGDEDDERDDEEDIWKLDIDIDEDGDGELRIVKNGQVVGVRKIQNGKFEVFDQANGGIGGLDQNLLHPELGDNLGDASTAASAGSGVIGLGQLGFSRTPALGPVVGTYGKLGAVRTVAGKAGTAAALVTVAINAQAVSDGGLTMERFGFRTTGTLSAIGVGALVGTEFGGPAGTVAGAAVGGVFQAAEYAYDKVNEFIDSYVLIHIPANPTFPIR